MFLIFSFFFLLRGTGYNGRKRAERWFKRLPKSEEKKKMQKNHVLHLFVVTVSNFKTQIFFFYFLLIIIYESAKLFKFSIT